MRPVTEAQARWLDRRLDEDAQRVAAWEWHSDGVSLVTTIRQDGRLWWLAVRPPRAPAEGDQ